MADDITLTVRVRDMTRGEFSDIRRRMRGMDGDIRGLAQSSNLASDRADRLSRSIRGVSGRLGQMQRTGSLAGREVDYMRRTMGLLSRDLRLAARSGELTEDEFRRLRDELEDTRLEFDRLDNELRRHSAVAQQRARQAAAQQREDLRRQMQQAAQINAHQRRIARAHAAALREEEQRNRRAEAERARLARQATARLRQQEAEFRRHVSRLSRMSDGDSALTANLRGIGDADHRRMAQAMRTLSNSLNTVSRSNFRARGSANALMRDLGVMGRIMRDAARDGRITQREFNALSNVLRQTAEGARSLHQSGAITRSTFRNMNREARLLRAQLNLLGNEGDIFTRLDARMLLFQNRLRDSHRHAGILRRSVGLLGEGMTAGMRGGTSAVSMMTGALRRMGGMININRRWTAILLAVLLLLGPAAQALGALLVTALGGAFIALGAFALRGSKQVRSAFSNMRDFLDSTLTDAAKPLEQALVGGMRRASIAVREMKPALKSVFEATSPLVDSFVDGIMGLVSSALPGFGKSLSEALPVMEGFRDAMSAIGNGLGEMFAAMTADGGNDALADVWRTLGTEIRNLLTNIGEFINAAAKSGAATMLMVAAFRSLSGILHTVEFSLAAVSALAAGALTAWGDQLRKTGKWIDVTDEKAKKLLNGGADADMLKQRLSDVNDEIEKILETRERANEQNVPMEDWERLGIDDKTLNAALEEREVLTRAVSMAESQAATDTKKHANSVRDLITQIQELAGQNRNHLDAVAAQEEAIDNATKKQGKWGNALKMTNGQLDLTTKAGRDAYEQLSNIARTTKEATDKAIEANVPWEDVNKQWKTGRENLIRLADGWGLNKEQAKELADQILGLPPKKDVFVEANTADAVSSLTAVIAAMDAAPNAKTITVKALSQEAQAILEGLGYEVQRLPDGSFTITAHTGAASMNVEQVQAARDKLQGKEITVSAMVGAALTNIGEVRTARGAIKDKQISIGATVGGALSPIARAQLARDNLKGKRINISADTGPFRRAVSGFLGATLGTSYINVQRRIVDWDSGSIRRFGAQGGSASSLPMKRFRTGGSISGQVLEGPGTKTSDSILARLSRGEFVMRAAAVDKYGVDAMRRINMGLVPRFAKGGDARNARNQIRADTTISHFGKMAGWRDAEFVSAVAKVDTVKDVVTGLTDMRALIQKATSGRTERSLLRRLDHGGQNLLFHQKMLIKVNKSLEKAKEKLDDLKDSASQLRNSIKTGIINEANITKAASAEDSRVTINTILSQMTASAGNSKQFSKMLSDLKKRGLSGALIEQIASAGIEGGGMETAAAILGGGRAEIKRLNALQKEITKHADATGKTAADAMYGAGIKAAEGLVKGLKKEKAAIEKHMLLLAKSMEKAIKRALGIRSPSRVMERIGHYTAEGFAVGMEKNRRPLHSWESLLDAPRGPARTPVPASRGSGEPMVIHLHIGGKNIGEVIIDPLRKSIRHRGGDVQAVLGK